MKGKRQLFALLMACLFLSACSRQESSNSTEEPTFSQSESDGELHFSSSQEKRSDMKDTEEIALTESAELLTMVLTQSTMGFSTDLDPESNRLIYPSAEDSNSVNQFLYLLAFYQSSGYEHSLYADDIYQDSDGIYHLSEEGVLTILQDVLGISTWDSSTSNFEYNAATQEYTSGLEFGTGCGGWKCGEIISSHIDVSQKKLTVEYKAEYLFPGASGRNNEKTSWNCRNIFLISEKEDGQPYLSFEKSIIGTTSLHEEPTEEELAELFCNALSEINLLATEDPCDLIRHRFDDVTIDSDDCIIIDEFPYARTSLDYSELVEYYANIFTDEALEWVLSTKFADVEGTLYCCLTGGQTGTGMQLRSIEKLREYTYQATFLSYHGIDETAGNSVVVVFEVKKTDAGYRISSTDYCPASLNREYLKNILELK